MFLVCLIRFCYKGVLEKECREKIRERKRYVKRGGNRNCVCYIFVYLGLKNCREFNGKKWRLNEIKFFKIKLSKKIVVNWWILLL